LNDDVAISLKNDGKMHVKIDAKDFGDQTFEVLLIPKVDYMVVSKKSIDNYFKQKDNLIVISFFIIGLILILFIYFIEKKPDNHLKNSLVYIYVFIRIIR